VACLALTAALGCDQVDYIEIKPDTLVFKQRNNEIWMQGHAMSHTGRQYPNKTPGWRVKDETIATVDSTGKLTPRKSGHTELVATIGKVTAEAPIDVLFTEKLAVSPSKLELVEGGPSVEVHVKMYDYQGKELRDRTPIFHSTDEKVFNMGQNMAFPVGPGSAKLDVMVEDKKETVVVTVEPEKKAAKAK